MLAKVDVLEESARLNNARGEVEARWTENNGLPDEVAILTMVCVVALESVIVHHVHGQ